MKSYDPLDVQSQESAKDAKDLAARLYRETDDADFKWLMGSKRGRRIVWRLLDRAGVFRSAFNTNSMAMAFAEGQKNEGLRILSQIHALCPELYSTMTREALHDNRSNDD